jgi:hypothetical protein
MRYYLLTLAMFIFLNGCSVGHKDWKNDMNNQIGTKIKGPLPVKPYRYKDAGKLQRGDFWIVGEGLTHITKDKDGNLVYHYFDSEILPNFTGKKEWIGKCKIYLVVDPKTHIIKGWGYDKDGNPLSCRTWP